MRPQYQPVFSDRVCQYWQMRGRRFLNTLALYQTFQYVRQPAKGFRRRSIGHSFPYIMTANICSRSMLLCHPLASMATPAALPHRLFWNTVPTHHGGEDAQQPQAQFAIHLPAWPTNVASICVFSGSPRPPSLKKKFVAG